MEQLDSLFRYKGTAANSMALFLAINTSNVTLLPTGVIGIRVALGSDNPAGIMPTTLMATLFSTTVAIIAAKTLERVWSSAESVTPIEDVRELPPVVTPTETTSEEPDTSDGYPLWVTGLAF